LFALGGLFVMLAAAVVAGAAIGALLLYESDYIMPGVQVLDVGLGGQTTAEAEATLAAHWQQRTITLAAGEATWSVSPDALGITLDAATTARAAYQQGRSLAPLERALRQGGRLTITPAWQIDPAVAEQALQALEPQLNVPPVNAGVRVVNGQVETTPALPGQALDVTATVTQLQQQAADAVLNGRFELITVPVEPTITDVSAVVARASQMLTSPLSLRAYDPVTNEAVTWAVAPEVWSTWLSLDVDPADMEHFTWTVDEEQARTYLEAQATTLGAGRYVDTSAAATGVTTAVNSQNLDVRLRVYHHERQHAVQPGETIASIGQAYGMPYPWIQQANPGVGDSLGVGQTLTIPSPDVLLPLPVVENKRIVVSISQQRMWAYENGALKWEWPVSTGIASSPTSPGVFQIQSHEPNAYAGNWDLWMPNFMGIYRPVPTSDFMNGFHGFPTRGNSQLLWTGDLGHKVTYGCILISSDNAQLLYEWAEEGVVVEVQA
jgi:lipoprotein-anchoring transpeptidase ErfK/SrfK